MHTRTLNSLILLVFLAGCGTEEGAKSGTRAAAECARSDLIAQCPPNTAPRLEVDAEAVCTMAGSIDVASGFDGMSASGAISNACVGSGSCHLVCELLTPCDLGVARITPDEGIVCRAPTGCGNGVCEPGETFADCPVDCGGDACQPDETRCQGERLQTCTPRGVWGEVVDCPAARRCVAAPGAAAACMALACGDGEVDVGEECDDANATNGDGCDANCTRTRCGNGVRSGDEACDDGNAVTNDGCTNECTLPACGDGIVQDGEQCDDGNDDDADRCTSGCRLPFCGDGIVQAGEACDDGNQADTDGCSPDCRIPGCGDAVVQDGEECDDGNDDDTDGCTNACLLALCGDGVVQGQETCDDGNDDDTDACTNACRVARCGDGAVQAGVETCDDGNGGNDDACVACEPARCGDGFLQAGVEACDDGNDVDDDGCTNACALPACGDGIVQVGEQCDDGNAEDADGCTARCRTATCGDGITRLDLSRGQPGFEACDDANGQEWVPGDACNNDCEATESEPNDRAAEADVIVGSILGVLRVGEADFFTARLDAAASHSVLIYYQHDSLLTCATFSVDGVACADLTFCGARGVSCRDRIPAGERLVRFTLQGGGRDAGFALRSAADAAFQYRVEITP
ncbi:MAG: DUF4215 domain-containing protein [Myxococcales bacterium]|nr:DUF4215 domain-containing protein [Myxococcales bacterium]